MKYSKVLESTEFYVKFDQATSRKLSVLSRSILSRRNFLKIESLEESERNSGNVFRSAIAATCSEGEKSDRTVLNQEPKEEKTSWRNAAERYCKRACGIKPV